MVDLLLLILLLLRNCHSLPALILNVLDVQKRRLLRRNKGRNVLHRVLILSHAEDGRRRFNLHNLRRRSLLHRLNDRGLSSSGRQRWNVDTLTRRHDNALNDSIVGVVG